MLYKYKKCDDKNRFVPLTVYLDSQDRTSKFCRINFIAFRISFNYLFWFIIPCPSMLYVIDKQPSEFFVVMIFLYLDIATLFTLSVHLRLMSPWQYRIRIQFFCVIVKEHYCRRFLHPFLIANVVNIFYFNWNVKCVELQFRHNNKLS